MTERPIPNEAQEAIEESRKRLFHANDILMQRVFLDHTPDRKTVQKLAGRNLISEEEEKYMLHHRTTRAQKRALLEVKSDDVMDRFRDFALDTLLLHDPTSVPLLLTAGILDQPDVVGKIDEITQIDTSNKHTWKRLLRKATLIRKNGGNVVLPSRDTISGILIMAKVHKNSHTDILPHNRHVGDVNMHFQHVDSPFELSEVTMSNPHLHTFGR